MKRAILFLSLFLTGCERLPEYSIKTVKSWVPSTRSSWACDSGKLAVLIADDDSQVLVCTSNIVTPGTLYEAQWYPPQKKELESSAK